VRAVKILNVLLNKPWSLHDLRLILQVLSVKDSGISGPIVLFKFLCFIHVHVWQRQVSSSDPLPDCCWTKITAFYINMQVPCPVKLLFKVCLQSPEWNGNRIINFGGHPNWYIGDWELGSTFWYRRQGGTNALSIVDFTSFERTIQ